MVEIDAIIVPKDVGLVIVLLIVDRVIVGFRCIWDRVRLAVRLVLLCILIVCVLLVVRVVQLVRDLRQIVSVVLVRLF